VKLKIRADLIEPRSVVRTNTAEIGEGGKTSFQESAPFPAPASSTTPARRPACAIAANADDFRSNFNVTVPGGELQRHGNQGADTHQVRSA
jgi:hypothetical protein